MKITLNKYQKLMATALELGTINVSGPASTGKTYFAAHWLAEKVEMYKDHPDGADVILHVTTIPRGMQGLIGALHHAADWSRVPVKDGRTSKYCKIGNVTIHFLAYNQMATLGPAERPVFFVEDAIRDAFDHPWETPKGYRGIRIIKSSPGEPEFCLAVEPVDGGNLPTVGNFQAFCIDPTHTEL